LNIIQVGSRIKAGKGDMAEVVAIRIVGPFAKPQIMYQYLGPTNMPMIMVSGEKQDKLVEHVQGELPNWAISGQAIEHGEASVPTGHGFCILEGGVSKEEIIVVVWKYE
jgi:hypothetical protein